jgi:hypothetical protein
VFGHFAKAPKNWEDKISKKKDILNNRKKQWFPQRFPPGECWGTNSSGLSSLNNHYRRKTMEGQLTTTAIPHSLFAIVPNYFTDSRIIYIFKVTHNYVCLVQNVYVCKITTLRNRFSAFSYITTKTPVYFKTCENA